MRCTCDCIYDSCGLCGWRLSRIELRLYVSRIELRVCLYIWVGCMARTYAMYVWLYRFILHACMPRMNASLHVYIHKYHMYIHIYTCIYIYIYIHICIHKCINRKCPWKRSACTVPYQKIIIGAHTHIRQHIFMHIHTLTTLVHSRTQTRASMRALLIWISRYIYAYTRISIHLYRYIFIRTHLCRFMYVFLNRFRYVCTEYCNHPFACVWLDVCMYVWVRVFMFICTCIHIYIYINICMYVNVYICIYINMYIYIYIYVHTNAYTYEHAHIFIHSSRSVNTWQLNGKVNIYI